MSEKQKRKKKWPRPKKLFFFSGCNDGPFGSIATINPLK